jgi:hypothetical protein
MPLLILGEAHLERWRDHALARFGVPDAINHLTIALAHLPSAFNPREDAPLVDLAVAHAAAGDRDAALNHARQARRLAAKIRSDR